MYTNWVDTVNIKNFWKIPNYITEAQLDDWVASAKSFYSGYVSPSHDNNVTDYWLPRLRG